MVVGWPPRWTGKTERTSLLTLGVAIAQNTYATDAGSEISALRELLDRVELGGLLVQADALHANRPFFSTSSSVAPTS